MSKTVSRVSGGVGTLLLLLLASVAGAQTGNDDARKRYISCAAVLSVAVSVATDKKLQEKFTTGSMILLLLASGSAPDQPAGSKTDQVMREFSRQVTEILRAIKSGTPGAAKEFEAKYAGELKSCESWIAAEIKKKKT